MDTTKTEVEPPLITPEECKQAAREAGFEDLGLYLKHLLTKGIDSRPVEHLPSRQPGQPRVGGIWKGRVQIADDFDEPIPNLQEAFGIK